MSSNSQSRPSTPFHMRDVESTQESERSEESASTSRVELGTLFTNPPINYAQFVSSGKGLASSARVNADGSIAISLDLKQSLPELPHDYARDVQEFAVDKSDWVNCPKLNIVIMIVGSRGDVQPYIALGKLLLKHGHRVRIATHETFRSFVNDAKLEFFNIGGDPADLMSYMVKNPGLIPGIEFLTNGDIGKKRKMLTEMMDGCWAACHSPCTVSGRTFVADAIISNPPTFAHVHCAEALGIPLLLTFTMPWSPTTAFPHPLVNIDKTNAEPGLSNYLTYAMADLLTWQGMGDLVNVFRKRLGLDPLSLHSGPGLADRLKIPWTYCMSPALVPKPKDWKDHIDVVGFYFLDLATSYTPPDDLAAFLAAGDSPIYIGFGSVVVEDPAGMSKTIFEATAQARVRALVSAGWGGLGGVSVPSHVFILGNVPHDWLFAEERVSAVVHHGGAGTTAVGLAKGRPTVVVPFFGDQGFWGSMIEKAGAGPAPIPHKELTVDKLREAIKFAISPRAKAAAARMADQIRSEDGVHGGVDSFYRHLPLLNMRCDVDPSRLAVWWSTEHCLKLSTFAAQTLLERKLLAFDSLELHRPKEYETSKKVSDPVSGGVLAIFWTITHYYASIAKIFYSPIDGIIKTTTAIPRGIMMIVTSVHDGFQNAPTLYGSNVRKPGKVTDFKSGVKEAGRGLFYGYYDGITGLVREPLEGAKKDGFTGAIKGFARSFVNVTMRPAAGIVGVAVHPFNGLWKQMQKHIPVPQQENIRRVRVADGVDAVRSSSAASRDEVVKAFLALKPGLQGRQREYAEAAEKVIQEAVGDALETPRSASGVGEDVSGGLGTHGGHGVLVSKGGSQEGTLQPGIKRDFGAEELEEEEDSAFHRDMELAMQLSLAEHRGYERGVAQGKERDRLGE